jgi:hypothetical protein
VEDPKHDRQPDVTNAPQGVMDRLVPQIAGLIVGPIVDSIEVMIGVMTEEVIVDSIARRARRLVRAPGLLLARASNSPKVAKMQSTTSSVDARCSNF